MLLLKGNERQQYPLLKDAPLYTKPNEIRKEAIKHLFVVERRLGVSASSYHGCHFDTSGSFHSVRNLPKEKKRLFDGNLWL